MHVPTKSAIGREDQTDEYRPLLAVHNDINNIDRGRPSQGSSLPPFSMPPTTMSHYDESLLASAPVATRAEKQEGYNVDLLDNAREAPKSGSVSPSPLAQAPLAPNVDYAEEGRTKESGAVYTPYAYSKPWYKTKKWIVIFTLIAIACVAAIIGGAVGGTLSHKSSKSNDTQANSPSDTNGASPGVDQPQGGQAGAGQSVASSASGFSQASSSSPLSSASAPSASTTSPVEGPGDGGAPAVQPTGVLAAGPS